MSDFRDRTDRELARLRVAAAEAMAKAGGDISAGLRVALDSMLEGLPSELEWLRAHGFEVEGASFFLGSQLGVFVSQDIDPVKALHHPVMGPIVREYFEKAKKL